MATTPNYSLSGSERNLPNPRESTREQRPDSRTEAAMPRSDAPTRLPDPEFCANPADLDVQEGQERMQGEPSE